MEAIQPSHHWAGVHYVACWRGVVKPRWPIGHKRMVGGDGCERPFAGLLHVEPILPIWPMISHVLAHTLHDSTLRSIVVSFWRDWRDKPDSSCIPADTEFSNERCGHSSRRDDLPVARWALGCWRFKRAA